MCSLKVTCATDSHIHFGKDYTGLKLMLISSVRLDGQSLLLIYFSFMIYSIFPQTVTCYIYARIECTKFALIHDFINIAEPRVLFFFQNKVLMKPAR